jgi:hypothetical protein
VRKEQVKMPNNNDPVLKKLDVIIKLLQHLLAVELHRDNVPHDAIGKKLCVAKAKVVDMMKGVKKKKS